MNKLLLCVHFVSMFSLCAKAQTPANTISSIQPYGQIARADLEMKTCDFEPDANAEILFDKANVYNELGRSTVMERHIRVKILNEFGKNAGNIRITYPGSDGITDIEGETLNLENGQIEITKLDKKLVYTEKPDKFRTTVTFALPDVKAGSVIEYKYKLHLGYLNWYFQSNLPTRYSEIDADLTAAFGSSLKLIPHIKQPLVIDIGKTGDFKQVKAMANIHSLPDETYMDSRNDNLQRIDFMGTSTALSTWEKIGDVSLKINQFGEQFDMPLSGEGGIIKKAKMLRSDNEKIAFIFDTVKNSMKWNESLEFYTNDGIGHAWDKKTGNSAEVNIILYRLLKKTGINARPMLVSTRKNGRINPANPSTGLFNNTVVYIPVDSAKYYVLDACDRYGLFNTIPTDELNTFGLSIDADNKRYEMVFMENPAPIVQSVFLNAEITSNGKMNGTAELTSEYYNKTNALKKYNKDGEEKYIKSLCSNDKNIHITAFKMEGMNVDSIPLSQKFNFNADLAGTDENYIYFNTSLFTLMASNPFVNENRYSDIDFGYRDNYAINGIYKVPLGYKTESLPKNVNLAMPDQSITFKRLVAEESGTITVRYVLNHKKTLYFTNDYQALRAFYQKLYQILNEQIVLKKA